MRLSTVTILISALAIATVALAGCGADAASVGPGQRGDVSEGPASLTGPYSLAGWGAPARMRPEDSEWSIELPSGGWWDFSSDPFDSGVTPEEATYRTSQVAPIDGQPYASVNIITLRSLEKPVCPAYNNFSPEGEPVSERLADMDIGGHTARVYRVTAAATDGSSSGEFNACFVSDGVMYSINAAARPTLAQVDLFKMLRTFRLDAEA